MWCLGIGGPGTAIYQWWPDHPEAGTRTSVREDLLWLLGHKPIVFQNAMADLPILEYNLNIKYSDFKQIEDLLFVHSLLWCELPHTLEFIASVSGWYEKMKHLPMSDPQYNAGDVAETIAGWEQYGIKEMGRDPQTAWVYRECMLPLIPIILESQRLGLRIDRSAVEQAHRQYTRNREYAQTLAQSYAGYPLNLGSQGGGGQVGQLLAADLKHWLAVPPKKISSVDEDAIAEWRGAILPFDPQQEVTMASTQQRIEEGGHPILEARVLYARATQYLSHYIKPMLESADGRVYAQFHPWTQHTGRWSTVDPPLAQLPASLRHALIPDEGWVWFEFDWDQIELRLIAALAHDEKLLEVFRMGYDPHTLNMCDFFGYEWPPLKDKRSINRQYDWSKHELVDIIGQELWAYAHGWTDTDDPRRVFGKTGVYRLCYGGRPESAPIIPGAKALGLPSAVLIAASKRWIASHQPVKQFWKRIERDALMKRQLRTFLGRRWNFLSHDKKRILRQMYDFPMQGGVADIMNLTLIRIKNALGDRVRLSYTMHDSIKLQVRETPTLRTDLETIRTIAQAEWDVEGHTMAFPAEFKRRDRHGSTI
jgi:DNA polymerase I-like protein with 3'-5' exonuclease and polymerase domains